MLKSLTLKNFRGFSEHRIDFSSETILIGQNNAGKTTAIEALRVLSVCQARSHTATFIATPNWLDGVCQGAGYRLSLETIDFDFANVQHGYDSENPAIIKAKFKNNSEIHIFLGQGPDQVFCQLRASQNKLIHSRAEMGSRSFGNVRVMPPVGSLLPHEKIITKERLNRFLDGYLAYRHFRNQLWERPANYRVFKKLLEETWHGLSVQHFENDHGQNANEYSLLVREGRFISEISWHGHGLQAWMQTVWFLARTPKDATVVLDEPDVYLHADLQRKLIKVIEGIGFNQAIIATHSSEIIGDVPFQNVTVIKKQDRVSKPADNAIQIQQALKGMGSLHSIQLSKIAQRGLLLFVEGDDKTFLTDVAYKMGSKVFDSFSTVAIQELKGKGNSTVALGAAKALNEASNGELQTALLLDNDYMTQAQRDEIFRKSSSSLLILKLWTKKEIENYFINPFVVTRFLSDRCDCPSPSIDEITSLMDEVVQSMALDLKLSISDVMQKASSTRIEPKTAFKFADREVAEKLKNGFTMYDLVDGKDFISKLSVVTHSRYGVSVTPRSLCKEMRATEYPSEITDFVAAICDGKRLIIGEFADARAGEAKAA